MITTAHLPLSNLGSFPPPFSNADPTPKTAASLCGAWTMCWDWVISQKQAFLVGLLRMSNMALTCAFQPFNLPCTTNSVTNAKSIFISPPQHSRQNLIYLVLD